MAALTGAETLTRLLQAADLRFVFGCPGSSEVDFLDALVDAPGLRYVLGLHETAVVAMADGYARASGRPAFVNLHSFAGTANALGSIFTAYADRVPLVISAGQQDTAITGRDAHGEVQDLPEVVRQMTKRATQVLRASRVADEAARALKVAITPPTGPTFFSIPKDCWAAEADGTIPDPAWLRVQDAVVPDPAQVRRAAELLAEARRPVLVPGGGVVRDGAAEELVELAERLALPVLSEPFGSSLAFPTVHPSFCGIYHPSHPLVTDADLVIGIGGRLFVEPDRPKVPLIPDGARVVHLHDDPWEIGRVHPAQAPVVASARAGLRALLAALGEQPLSDAVRSDRSARLESGRARWEAEKAAELAEAPEEGPIRPARLVRELSRALGPDAIIVNQSVTSGNYLVRHYEFGRADGFMMCTSAYMGWGMGALLGIKLALPERTVVGFTGDGVLAFAPQALWTAAHERIPVLYVVINNRAYMAIRSGLYDRAGRARATGTYLGSELLDPPLDLVRIAEGFGLPAERVERLEEVGPAVRRAMGRDGPALLEVITDPRDLGGHRPRPK